MNNAIFYELKQPHLLPVLLEKISQRDPSEIWDETDLSPRKGFRVSTYSDIRQRTVAEQLLSRSMGTVIPVDCTPVSDARALRRYCQRLSHALLTYLRLPQWATRSASTLRDEGITLRECVHHRFSTAEVTVCGDCIEYVL
jgi:hypothetical protein